MKMIEAKTIAFYYESNAAEVFGVSKSQYITCDQVAVACVIDPAVVKTRRQVACSVELQGALTRGQMVVDWQNLAKVETFNAQLVTELDVDAYGRLLMTVVQDGPAS